MIALQDQILPRRSELAALGGRDHFVWMAGIEDSVIAAPHPVTGRTLDEYALTEHYARLAPDIDLLASLGVPAARYGVPWSRVQPAPDRFDWSFADEALGRLLDRGVAPIVDLVHYGVPAWLDGAFLHRDYPARVADYAGRLAERFRGRIFWYTPLNEPRITAWYCGRLGWWPPFRRSWPGFVALMLAICRGIAATVRALAAVDPEIVCYHVDATDLYEAGSPDLEPQARQRQEIVFLALDLLAGRVDERHMLWDWLLAHGARPAELEHFLANPVELSVLGLNLYPMFTAKRLFRQLDGRLRVHMPYAGPDLIPRLAALYGRRYGVPMMIAETASAGSVKRRLAWLDASVRGVAQARREGLMLSGYTWWPIFALVTWAYRQGSRPLDAHLAQMGLWNLDRSLDRIPTALVDAYRDLVKGGALAVGPLAQAP